MDALSLGTLGAIGGGASGGAVVIFGPIRMAIDPSPAGSVRLRQVRGEDKTWEAVVYDGLGELRDLTGHTITSKFRPKSFGSPIDPPAALTKTWTIVSPPQGGRARLTITGAEAEALLNDEYDFDAWDDDGAGHLLQVLPVSTYALSGGVSFP